MKLHSLLRPSGPCCYWP